MIADNQKFLGRHYRRGNRSIRCRIGDEVIIHPTRHGRSQAKKSYPAMVVLEEQDNAYINGKKVWRVMCVKGIRGNYQWHGAWINDYCFNRLEFVRRNCDDQWHENYA